jgi:hypothetical protein
LRVKPREGGKSPRVFKLAGAVQMLQCAVGGVPV